MKTIVCPFDNSAVASNALAYAKNLSKNTQSQLVLFKKQFMHNLFRNSQFAYEPAQVFSHEFSQLQQQPTNRQALAENAEPVMQMQSISAIAAVACSEKADVIVAGTEAAFGYNDLYMETIGNLLRQTQCPLLLVPEGVSFTPIKKIVVVIEHEANITHRIDFLLKLAKLYQANLSFLQITHEEHQQAGTNFLESWREMYLAFPYENTDFFETTHTCIPKAIREFVSKAEADLLVVIPDRLTISPYGYATSHLYNEYAQEPVTLPVLALDSSPMPAVDLLFNYYK